MKKVVLLFTLALMSISAIKGMENPQPELKNFQNLPDDLKNLIILAFASSGSDLDAAIKNINIAILTNKALNQMVNEKYGNLKGFTALVHMFADKFNTAPFLFADKFEIPIAEEYVDLAERLQWFVVRLDKEKTKELIQLGADINSRALIKIALQHKQVTAEFIQFLLNNGANPNAKNYAGNLTALEDINKLPVKTKEHKKIKALLEEAIG